MNKIIFIIGLLMTLLIISCKHQIIPRDSKSGTFAITETFIQMKSDICNSEYSSETKIKSVNELCVSKGYLSYNFYGCVKGTIDYRGVDLHDTLQYSCFYYKK